MYQCSNIIKHLLTQKPTPEWRWPSCILLLDVGWPSLATGSGGSTSSRSSPTVSTDPSRVNLDRTCISPEPTQRWRCRFSCQRNWVKWSQGAYCAPLSNRSGEELYLLAQHQQDCPRLQQASMHVWRAAWTAQEVNAAHCSSGFPLLWKHQGWGWGSRQFTRMARQFSTGQQDSTCMCQ